MYNPTEVPRLSITKLIPVTALITIFSQLSVLIYYSAFNFSPIGYFDPYEIIIASFKDFIIIGIILVLYIQIVSIHIIDFLDWVKSKIQARNAKNTDSVNVLKTRGFKTEYIGLGIIIISGILLIKYNLLVLPYSIYFFIIIIMYLISLNNAKYHFTLKNKSKNDESHAASLKDFFPYIDFVTVFFIAISIISIVGMSEVKSTIVKKHNPYDGTRLTLEDGEIVKCNSLLVLIGKSNNYYFFYNKHDEGVKVVRRDKVVKEYIFKSNKTKASFLL